MDSGFALVSTQIRVTTAHAVRFPANSSHMCCLELALKGVLCPVDDPKLSGCLCLEDMAVRMREVLPGRGLVHVCPLL